MLEAEPDDLEDRELHQVEEVFAYGPLSVLLGGQPVGKAHVARIHIRQRGIAHPHLPQVHLHLHELGEVGKVLGLALLAELQRGVDQPGGDGGGGEGLEEEREFGERHAARVRADRACVHGVALAARPPVVRAADATIRTADIHRGARGERGGRRGNEPRRHEGHEERREDVE